MGFFNMQTGIPAVGATLLKTRKSLPKQAVTRPATLRFGDDGNDGKNIEIHHLPRRQYDYEGPAHIPPLRKPFALSVVGIGAAIATTALLISPPVAAAVMIPWAIISAVGIKDMSNPKHSLPHNYPVFWRFRPLGEGAGSPLRQYVIESDTEETPFSREQRQLVYARAKGQNDKKAFGTLHDLKRVGAEWMSHSIRPKTIDHDLRVTIGGPQCKQPYSASVFNTSGMSFGSLSPQAVMALAKGAYLDNFFVNTGEGGISPFHLGFDVDINDKNFDFEKILKMAQKPLTQEEIEEARRNGKAGVIERGLVKLLPLNPDEQLAAIRAGQEEFIRNRITELLGELSPEQLQALGIETPEQVSTATYDAYRLLQAGLPVEMEPEARNVILPIITQVAQEIMNEPAKAKNTINEEILVRGVGKVMGADTPEEIAALKKTRRGRILKGMANKLRMNTMQYTRFPSGDIVWNIGTGYFGCRNPDGTFSEKEFARKARLPQVKMIELKLSQGAKPGGGGILPAEKVTPGLAKMRDVPAGKACLSPSAHSAFSTPVEMMRFIQRLRDLSGGKPVGFKLCIGKPHEFLALCKAMRQTGIYPDFITIDGAEGGTGAAPQAFSNEVGMPLDDALVFANNALIGTGLRDKIKIIASGKVVDEFDIISKIARGADTCNAARAMMFSIGCIMARICHTNKCPVGVATQDPDLAEGLAPDDKGLRNASYHRETIKGLKAMLGAASLQSTEEVTPDLLMRRVTPTEIQKLSKVYQFLQPGDLINGNIPESLREDWEAAQADSFDPAPRSELGQRIARTIQQRQAPPDQPDGNP